MSATTGPDSVHNRDGVLWLLDAASEDPDWPWDEEHTTHPPVCLPCAALSAAACPHLRHRYVLLRVRTFALSPVHGALYQPVGTSPQPVDAVALRFGDPRTRWLRGGQLIMHLSGFVTTDLRRETRARQNAEIASGPAG